MLIIVCVQVVLINPSKSESPYYVKIRKQDQVNMIEKEVKEYSNATCLLQKNYVNNN
jgi:hypothetical protein